MACVYVFGIPLAEDAECAETRRKQRNRKIGIRQDGRTARTESRTERTITRQTERTARTGLRTAPGATTPLANVVGAVGDAAGGILGGLFGPMGEPGEGGVGQEVLLLGGAVAVVGVAAYAAKKGKR